MGCGRLRPKEELVRFARSGEGAVVPDPDAVLPGRGVYLCPRPACADEAMRRGGFQRSLRGSVTVGAETLDFIGRWRRSESTR